MPIINKGKRLTTIAALTLVCFLANPTVAAQAEYPINFSASASAPVELVMHPGADGFTCDGLAYDSPAPIRIDGTLFLPFRAIAEAFGARIDYIEGAGAADADAAGAPKQSGPPAGGSAGRAAPQGSPRITGEFMSNKFTLYPGADFYTLNGSDADLPELLRFVDDVAYVPASVFDGCIGTETFYDEDSDAITIRLEDDGGVLDLSGLLGEIRETAIGNSYYNWRIDVPIKSMLLSSSFNGDDVLIYSSLRNAYIEIAVRPGEGLSPEFYASNHDSISDDFYVESAQVHGTGASGYAQAVLGGYGASALMRIYPRSKYDYIVTVVVAQDEYDGGEFDTKEFYTDNPYSRLLDTFEINAFKAGDKNVKDLSKVVGGRIEYINYLDVPDSKTLLTPWSVSVLPAWTLLYESAGYNVIAVLGEGEDENLTVAAERMPPQITADEFLSNYADLDADRFNGGAYRLLGTKSHRIDRRAALDIYYTLNSGAAVAGGGNGNGGNGGAAGGFMFYERLIPSGETLFRLRLKIKKQKFDNNKDIYIGLLDSFKIFEDSLPKTAGYLAKQGAALRELRLSEAEAPVKIGDAADKWSSALPGDWIETDNWQTSDFEDFGVPGYCDPDAGAFIFVLFEPYDGSEEDADGAGPISSMEYAQSLVDDEYEEEEGFVIGEPAPAPAGGNDFAVISYTREPEYYNYEDLYPGYPFSGEIYILADTEGVYFIYSEIPYVLNSPANGRGIEMFLSEFRAGGRYAGTAEAPVRTAGPADGALEEEAAGRAARTGAVG